MIPADFNIYDLICRNAQIYGDRDCIVFDRVRLSFREYKHKCDQLAAGLVHSGLEKGDRLAVVSLNSDQFMIIYGAAAKIGAIVVPVNWRFQEHELEYVLNDCTPRVVFAGLEYREAVAKTSWRLDSVENCYAMGGGEVPKGFHPMEELYSAPDSAEGAPVPAGSGFVIIHTAAVEGRPRGALLSQANIIYANLQMMHLYGLQPEDVHLCVLPLFHIAGLSMSMAVMHGGGKNVILDRFDPARVLRSVEQEKVTTFFHFPPMLKMLIDKYQEDEGSYDLSSIRNVGGIDQPENLSRFQAIAPNARLWTAFGQTEAMPVTAGLMEERPGSAGKPTPLSRVALFDDYDREVPVGTPGEICVRSPVVFMGYWRRDEDNAYTFRNGWHHTGDIGRLDEDGYLWYVKRKAQKELIKPGGENVYPVEVEKVILQHQDIAEVAVIGVPDEQWGEAVKAVCVLKPGRSLDGEALIDFVASRIARYKKPKFVVFVDSLPKTPEGEIDRDRVKKEHGGKY